MATDLATSPSGTAAHATVPARPRALSLRNSILWLVLACLLPMFMLAAYLARQNYLLVQQRLHSQSLLMARNISARMDRELTAIESGLKVLATSDYLAAGDLRRFHQQARDAVRSQIVYNYILTDAQGRQLLNTLRPFGTPLPSTGTPAALQRVFEQRTTVLTDLFEGPVVRRPVLAMGVPVEVDGVVRYSLNIGLDPKALASILREESISEEWLAVLLDSTATIVARTRNPEKFVGQKAVPEVARRMLGDDEATLETVTKEGTPVISSHHRSKAWGWIAAVGVNRAILDEELHRSLQRLFAGFAGAALLGWGLAWLLSRRLLHSLRALNAAARSVAMGNAHPVPEGGFRETEDIAEALHLATVAMDESRHRASHDALTGLANRALFDELAQKQLARSQREGSPHAVLAIDLDHFKQVNDTGGHALGDALLREVAQRMLVSVRNFDTVARLGGDEFLVLLAQADVALAQEVARRLIDTLSQPYPGTDVAVSASIGIALFPEHGDNNTQLLQRADQALYTAKRSGRSCAVVWSGG